MTLAIESDWTRVQPQLPETVVDIATVLDTLVEVLVAILDVVRAVLHVVQAFAIGYIDPVNAVIEAIVTEIEGLLADFRQAGVYFSGDLNVEPPFDDIVGGFTAYERRMVGRLLDPADVTRPQFNTSSTVVAVFLYESFDSTDIKSAISFVNLFRQFFGLRGIVRAYTIPTGLSVSYGSENTGIGAFGLLGDVYGSGEDPTVATVMWQMSPPPGTGVVSWPMPAPPGFIIEVSTVVDGLYLACDAPVSQAQPDDSGEQHRRTSLITSPEGLPFKLYGGLGILSVDSGLAWVNDGDLYTAASGAGAAVVFAYRTAADNVPIPLNALVVDGRFILQRTFFVDIRTLLGINVVAPGQQFSTILSYEDMPYDATFEDVGGGQVRVMVSDEPARTVFVRVSAVTEDVTAGSGDAASTFSWTLNSSRVDAGVSSAVRLGVESGVDTTSKSDPSSALTVTFPSASTSSYLDAVATAIAVVVLSRADLLAQGSSDVSFQADVAGAPTGLEEVARFIVPQVLGNTPSRVFKKTYPDVVSFRGMLRKRCRALANNLLAKTGPIPDSVLRVVLGQTQVSVANGSVKFLADVTWQDLDPIVGVDATILDSVDPTTLEGQDARAGVGPNPIAIGNFNASLLENRIGSSGTPLVRTPGFVVPLAYVDTVGDSTGSFAKMGVGSADYSPVIYSLDGGTIALQFCRNVFASNESIFVACRNILNVASSTLSRPSGETGAWTAYRLFPQGFPPVDAMLSEIVDFLDVVGAGTAGASDVLEAYITFVEARILELEAMLRRIQGLLDVTLSIQVPAVAGLVVTGNGMSDILQSLVTAGNKPADSSATVTRINAEGNTVVEGTYGLGTVMVAGGLPTSVFDLLLLLFPPE